MKLLLYSLIFIIFLFVKSANKLSYVSADSKQRDVVRGRDLCRAEPPLNSEVSLPNLPDQACAIQ